MRTIRKKTWPEYFQAIVDGKKTFELRLADFDCEEGDLLVLEEWDPKTKKHTGRKIEKKITFIVKTKNQTFHTEQEVEKYGWQVIGMGDK